MPPVGARLPPVPALPPVLTVPPVGPAAILPPVANMPPVALATPVLVAPPVAEFAEFPPVSLDVEAPPEPTLPPTLEFEPPADELPEHAHAAKITKLSPNTPCTRFAVIVVTASSTREGGTRALGRGSDKSVAG